MLRLIREFLYSGTDNQNYLSVIKWIWRIVGYGSLGVLLLFLILSFTNLPSVKQLENPRSDLASQIFAENGDVLGVYYSENRVPITYDSLSPHLVHALIATEDLRFYEHAGIDFEALGRVAVKTVLLGDRSSGGASTITQQLAKLLFTRKPGSGLERVMQKLKEWIIAVRLERKYTKEEIMAMYLNKADFVNNAYGIKAATSTYFQKKPRDLEVHEAAMLIGMLQNPSRFNPLRHPERCTKRREIVLKQMVKAGYLTNTAYDDYRLRDLDIRFSRQTHIDGIATYFRESLKRDLRQILNQKENLRPDGTPYDIYRDGLRIYTTIEPEMQRMAEQAMVKHMASVQKAFWREWAGKDPWTFSSKGENNIPSPERRQEELNYSIRSTNRYQYLRDRYLHDVLNTLESRFPDMKFSEDDREIERMYNDNRKSGYLEKLVANGRISAAQAAQYRRVMNSAEFTTLMTQWEILQGATRDEFRRPVRMRVFTFDPRTNFEKDTTMSPLDSIRYHRMHLQTGMLAVDPRSGQVKAWVGGINYKYFQFDHIRNSRQVGSTFKPFVYAAAIAQMGLSPCYTVHDVPQTIYPGEGDFGLSANWSPRNFNNEYSGGSINMREGLRKSKNSVSVKLVKELGSTRDIRTLIHEMGIDSSARYANGEYRVPKSPAICLGAADLSVWEMTGAFATFANNGVHAHPLVIKRIEDKNGKIIYEGIPNEDMAINPNPNYVMVDMLRYAANVKNLKSDVGGKTGTTNDFVDGWFMGITPTLVVGTWVGGEDRWIHFRSSANGQGARMAKPMFIEFIRLLENNQRSGYDPNPRFFRPPGDLGIELDCGKYQKGAIDYNGGPARDSTGKKEDQFGDEF
jgi:penicillin-binding protein 1A